MREIKFRAWNKKEKLFDETGFVITRDGKPAFINWWNLELEFLDDNFVIQQYTGLKDKNGIEIYEGDILGYEEPFSDKTLTKVVWEKAYSGEQWCEIRIRDNAGCEVQDNEPTDFYGGVCAWKIVVGNIFEGNLNDL